MKALIKKEVLELLWPVIVLFIGACWACFAMYTLEGLLLAPRFEIAVTVAGAAIGAGALIGYLQFAAERWRGTLGFALHRAQSFKSIFIAKTLVGVSASVLLAFGPLLVFAAWQALFSVNAPVIQGERLVEYGLCALAAVSGHALGMLASQMRRGWWFDISALVLGAGGVFAVTYWTLTPGLSSVGVSIVIYLVVQSVMFIGLATLSETLMRHAHDGDLPLPHGTAGPLAVLGVVVYVLPATIALSAGIEQLQGAILRTYPVVARMVDTGELKLMERGADELREHRSFSPTAQEMVTAPQKAEIVCYPTTDGRSFSEAFWNSVRSRRLRCDYAIAPRWDLLLWSWGASRYESHGRTYSLEGFLDHEAGVLRLFWTVSPKPGDIEVTWRGDYELPPTLPFETSIAKPTGSGRFSSSTFRCLLGPGWCLIDPEDKSLWKVSPAQFSDLFRELHLPDGDRFVRIEPFYERRSLRRGAFATYEGYQLFVGERGSYLWRDGKFELYTGQPVFEPHPHGNTIDLVPASEVEHVAEVRPRQTNLDPIHPRVEVRDGTDKNVLFEHVYSPSTVRAELEVALLFVGALLRTPAMCLYSFAVEGDDPSAAEPASPVLRDLKEPLLFAEKRPWLVVLNLMLATVCAVSIVRRMRRRGASSITIVLAALLTGLTGVIAYVYFRGLMPKRALVATPTSVTSEARDLLIQSA